MEAIHSAEPLPAGQLETALPLLIQQWADRPQGSLQPAGALELVQLRGALRGLPRAGTSASVSAEVVIALLQRANRAFLSAELLGWLVGRSRWRYVIRLRDLASIHGIAAPMGCEVRLWVEAAGPICSRFDLLASAQLIPGVGLWVALLLRAVVPLERSGLRSPGLIDRLLLGVVPFWPGCRPRFRHWSRVFPAAALPPPTH